MVLEDALASGRWVPGLPDWQWHPTRPRLLRRARVGGEEILLQLDLDRDGPTRLDERPLAGLAPQGGPGIHGTGRAGPPGWLADPDGDGVLVAVSGHLVWLPGGAAPPRVLTREAPAAVAGVEVAPGGRWVVFTAEHDVWAARPDDGKLLRLTHDGGEARRNGSLDWVVPEELGLTRGTWIAPDARHVAYLQLDEEGVDRFAGEAADGGVGTEIRYPRAGTRNPRPRVGVVSLEGGATTWLDLGDPAPEYVARAAWSPDGRALLVTTLDRSQRWLRLLLCPREGGAPTLLLEERDEAWVDVPPAPHFVDATRFLWRSHRDGATRWYLVDLPGAEPVEARPGAASLRPVTAPGIDVPERPFLDPATLETVYVGMRHGALRARPYVGLDAVEATFAPPPGFHTEADLDPTGRWAVVTWSNAVTPPRRELRRVADGRVVQAFADARLPRLEELALAVPEVGTMPGEDGPIRWRLWRAPGADARQPRPLVVRVYGGPGSRQVVDRWERSLFLTSVLTGAGYHVLEVDGRGTSGYGAPHERAVAGRLGRPEIDDQAAAVRHVAERPDVDGARVGIFGWSFGGTLTCLGLTCHPDVFRVGVAIAPVTDWRLYDTIYTERYLGLPAARPDAYDETAAVAHAAALEGHLLLLHGTNDENVHVENTRQLVRAFEAAHRATFDVKLYPGRGHGLGGAHHDLYERLLAYFARHLQGP